MSVSAPTPTVITTERGAVALLVESYVFHKQRTLATGNVTWNCSARRSATCKARICTCGGGDGVDYTLVMSGCDLSHEHPAPSAASYKARAQVKQAIANGVVNVRNTVRDAIDSVAEDRRQELPSSRALAQSARRTIRKTLQIPPEPASREDINLRRYHNTQGGVRVLFDDFDVNDDRDKRVIMYAHKRTLAFLATCDTVVLDGTFAQAPAEFPQLYTVMGVRQGGTDPITHPPWAVPCVLCLMPDRKQATYEAVFRRVSDGVSEETGRPFMPATCLLDFERGARNALSVVWPETAVFGCFFHLSQIVWRRLQAGGLKTRANTDPAFTGQMKALPALAFVPPVHVPAAFDELKADAAGDAEALGVMSFFEDNYIGRRAGNNGPRAAPKTAAIAEWSMFGRVLARQPRTQNALEAWHHAFSVAMNAEQHPSVYKVLTAFITELALSLDKVDRCSRGEQPRKRTPARQARERAIFTMVTDFEQRQQRDGLLRYCVGMGHNIKWPGGPAPAARQPDGQLPVASDDDSEAE